MRAIWRWSLVLVGSTVMLGQGLPIKMGLWESTNVIDDGDGSPATMKVKNCVTAADWQNMIHSVSQMPKGCTQNMAKTAHGFTFTASCNLTHTSMQTHGSSTFADSEHLQMESDTVMTIEGKTRHVVSRSSGHFVSANCGAVKPGDPEIE